MRVIIGEFSLWAAKFLRACILLTLIAPFIFSEPVQAQTASVTANAASVSNSLTPQVREAVFEEVWRLINEKYYDPKFHGVDWDSVRRRYQPQVAKASSEAQFYNLLDRMAGELRDSHTRVYSPLQRRQQIEKRRTSVGVTIRKIESKSVIVSVAPDSEAARAGVKAGMIIRKINDREIDEALADARSLIGISSSERSTEMRAYSAILAGEPGAAVTMELLDFEGRIVNVSLRRQITTSKPNVSARLLDSGVFYLKFSGFDPSLENEINKALLKFKNAPAMILDLRNNPGGDGEMGLRFAGSFFENPVTVASLVTRTGKPPIPEMPMILQTAAQTPRFRSRPLVVLINEATASTAELIANALQEQNRAVIFGTQTCGCVLGFLDYKKLTSGGFLTMSEFGFVTPKKRTLETAGITPDRVISPTIEILRTGRDAALEEAENYLKKKK